MVQMVKYSLALTGLMLPLSALAVCPKAQDDQALSTQLDHAEASFAALETDKFFVASDRARLNLECLGGVVPRHLAAQYHRLEGIRRFTSGDQEGARFALLAAGLLDPDYEFPAELLPASHELREYLKPGEELPGVHRAVPPREGSLVFDGVHTNFRPDGRSTLYQRTDTSGAVIETWYLTPELPLPTYVTVPRKRNHLLLGAGGSLLGSATMTVLGMVARAHFDDRNQLRTEDQLSTFRSQTRGFAWASGTFGLTAVGLGVAAMAVGDQ